MSQKEYDDEYPDDCMGDPPEGYGVMEIHAVPRDTRLETAMWVIEMRRHGQFECGDQDAEIVKEAKVIILKSLKGESGK